jgi:hypothetical protein
MERVSLLYFQKIFQPQSLCVVELKHARLRIGEFERLWNNTVFSFTQMYTIFLKKTFKLIKTWVRGKIQILNKQNIEQSFHSERRKGWEA